MDYNEVYSRKDRMVFQMAIGIRTLSILLLAAGLLGGCQEDSGSESSPENRNAAEVIKVQDERDEVKDEVEDEVEPAVSQDATIAGEVIENQSFTVTLEPAGEFDFITSQEASQSERPLYHFYLKNQKGLTELKYDWNDMGYAELKAVAFRDVNQDDQKDILAIIDHTTGAGRMGTIPYSTVIVFVQRENGFEFDASLGEAIIEANAYRQITVDQTMELVHSGFESNADIAWESLNPGAYQLEGSSEMGGSVITITEARADRMSFALDAFSVRGGEEGLKQGNVNIGHIESAEAIRSYHEMLFKDEAFELSLSLISPDVLYAGVRDESGAYFGHGVYVEGIYTMEK